MPGYDVGPVLPAGERAWPCLWEQDPTVLSCPHPRWESCLVTLGRFEEVVRCASCRAPRCGSSTDPNPCVRRRHHLEPHEYLSGRREAVGA